MSKTVQMRNDRLDRVVTWTTDDVSDWLTENDLSQYIELLCAKHKLDGKSLLTLTESDLRQPPLNLEIVGDIKRLMIGIWKLQKLNSESCYLLMPDDSSSASDRSMNEDEITNDRPGIKSKNLDPELWKTALSFLYAFSVSLLNALIVVIVHNRIPDRNKYPPLPDILLDNIPYVPWAFKTAEIFAFTLSLMWFSILFFHKHRFILIRRMFTLSGTMYLLRCVTMLITSLSVPAEHIQCEIRSYNSFMDQLKKAFFILKGFGMSIHGVKNCGDYMFSGHTVILTLLNFFIAEYCPSGSILIPMLSWSLNLLGMFFVLAAHEHYSIDLFIAFYIASRLFLYYHTFANNRSLMLHDRSRAKFWFPLFSYFESKCDGIVPNEYEWPLPWPKSFKRLFSNKYVRNKDHRSLLLVRMD
ncbi:sphingomyelin synthase-related protein 1-like [Tubulanus polymorphus]|uniref:sphingomyelin synthase-related protein 1-like n=1 Tax=Tubulanus polymorphus TaxID=672921 RepID=UPI003DA65222